MIFALVLATSTALEPPSMPLAMRGVWDLPGHCKLPSDESDSRAVVREADSVFWETVFTPRRILNAYTRNWAAMGEFDEEGEVSKGRLNLRLSPDRRTLTYAAADNRIVRLVLCHQQRR